MENVSVQQYSGKGSEDYCMPWVQNSFCSWKKNAFSWSWKLKQSLKTRKLSFCSGLGRLLLCLPTIFQEGEDSLHERQKMPSQLQSLPSKESLQDSVLPDIRKGGLKGNIFQVDYRLLQRTRKLIIFQYLLPMNSNSYAQLESLSLSNSGQSFQQQGEENFVKVAWVHWQNHHWRGLWQQAWQANIIRGDWGIAALPQGQEHGLGNFSRSF